jgi:hypothetical protein
MLRAGVVQDVAMRIDGVLKGMREQVLRLAAKHAW